MKKVIIVLVCLSLSFTSNSQQILGKYSAYGKEYPCWSQQDLVLIQTSGANCDEQTIGLKGAAVESFKKSLINVKEEYLAMKEDCVKDNENKEGTKRMSTKFESLKVTWKQSGKSYGGQGVCLAGFTVALSKKTNSHMYTASILGNAIDSQDLQNKIRFAISFKNEDEIQSLIDILEEAQGAVNATPQNSLVGTDWFPSDARVFDYSSFTNGIAYIGARTTPRSFMLKGIISPSAIEKYNIMCIETRSGGGVSYDHFIFPNERTCNTWILALAEMKALFLKNDQIAKENNVISDVIKDVSDNYYFDGFYGSITSSCDTDRYIIVHQYNADYESYEYGDVRQYKVGVFYVYKDGKSSMELRLANYFSRRFYTIWTFNSVEDFDELINVLDWSSFMRAFHAEAEKIRQEQAMEKRKRNEQALFD